MPLPGYSVKFSGWSLPFIPLLYPSFRFIFLNAHLCSYKCLSVTFMAADCPSHVFYYTLHLSDIFPGGSVHIIAAALPPFPNPSCYVNSSHLDALHSTKLIAGDFLLEGLPFFLRHYSVSHPNSFMLSFSKICTLFRIQNYLILV